METWADRPMSEDAQSALCEVKARRRFWRPMVIPLLLAMAASVHAIELELITEALFHGLSQTVAFDANGDHAVTAADLTARVTLGERTSAGCGSSPAGGGWQSIQVGAALRQYIVRLPIDYGGQTPRPLVLGFHGFTNNADYSEAVVRADLHWPQAIAVYAQGLDRTFPGVYGGMRGPGWQIAPAELDDRDILFFDELLERLLGDYCVNPHRVYVTGHSNGAVFANLLGCLRGANIAAIAPMAGMLISCVPSTPVAAILSHGTEDKSVPFGSGLAARSAWQRANQCSRDLDTYASTCEINADCSLDRAVAFCRFAGGHAPDPLFPPVMFRFFRERVLLPIGGDVEP